jgi:MFS family permease
VFGALVDRVGAKPVLLLGLVGFAAASAGFVVANQPRLFVSRGWRKALLRRRSPRRQGPWSPYSADPNLGAGPSVSMARPKASVIWRIR